LEILAWSEEFVFRMSLGGVFFLSAFFDSKESRQIIISAKEKRKINLCRKS
jgi:hypothetical protein